MFLGIRNNLGLLTIMFASVASKKKNKMRDLGPVVFIRMSSNQSIRPQILEELSFLFKMKALGNWDYRNYKPHTKELEMNET